MSVLVIGAGSSALATVLFTAAFRLGDPITPQVLLPGLVALALYYRALGHTPASRATLAELAFPLSAVVVGIAAVGARPTGCQRVGFVLVLAAVLGLALNEHRSARPSVAVPDDAREALEGVPAPSPH